ncbi:MULTISPECIES: TetR/AcrR family transcriptional regulator [unclassified Streptomyces]|uniref:TetR/AcrR family transcriptional regulator n=1 Tax=unclassified Streptomyces TaxID=2593676 RepID=UPI002DD949A4|nr:MULTISPECIES: TetR family transcriptional regulator [unclassified Streptomyces]WSC49797.1 TetR family transcriptional regulator [Streptomyces sp. NBC_01762]WSC51446.1 TetR family transcriptional regulator [Streptomyces sp. NBC_01761]WSF82297.1 TetR family transcriptional regulator [Streptomyces sp. NBC_01744]
MSKGAESPCPNNSAARPVAAARGRRPSGGSGRRPGQSGTRTQILEAALELFATKGYSGTTMRGIAQRAQVDPALIHHFFNNKDGLFQDAVSSRIDMSTLFDSLMDEKAEAGLKNRGERIARTFLSFWEDESTRPALVAVYRTSLLDEAAAKAFRDQIEAAFASCLGRTAPEETERTPAFTSLMSAQLAGLVMLRYVVAVEPLASLDFEDLMEWLVPAIEVHFDRLPQE